MYICQKCHKTQGPRVKQNRVTIESRPVAYTRTVRDNRGEETIIEIGQGSEIVREEIYCETCATNHTKFQTELESTLKAA